MSAARDQILGTIRRSLGVTGDERPRRTAVENRLASHPSGVLPARALQRSRAERIRLFVEMAEASAATVATVASRDDVPDAVAAFLRNHNLAPALRRGADPRLAGLPWDRTTLDVSTGRTFGDDAAGVSAAHAGVAETGTLVMVSGPENPSTLNLLPDNHIVVLDAADIAATYEDVWGTIRDRYGSGLMPRTVNWITGPSRSADIEQVLLLGAHGPRRLHIVLVDPEHASDGVDEATAEPVPAGSTPAEPRVGSTLAVDPNAPEDGPRAPGGKMLTETPAPAAPTNQPDPHAEEDLDEALEESFPASDPPSQTQP